MSHTQVDVVHPVTARTMSLDTGIAELIQAMWRAGIETVMSCEETRPGIVWIEFPLASAQRFLEIVSQYNPNTGSLYWRALRLGDNPWTYDLHPEDWNRVEWLNERDEIEHKHVGAARISFDVSIRFPRSDIPEIVTRLGEAVGDRERWSDDRSTK